MRWTVVIPAKALPAAKSRLAPMTPDAQGHGRLVEAIRHDTVAAAQAATSVARVLMVVDHAGAPGVPAGFPAGSVVVQQRPGLDAAVAEAAEFARRHWPDDGVAALVGDLPALRPDELSAALDAAATHVAAAHEAAAHEAAFVPDAPGTGTTLLAAVDGRLRPAFGAGSAQRHARHAVALDAAPGLRHDVDTEQDLYPAAELGVGPATVAVLADMGVTVRSTCLGMMPG